jgi:hypothetical protein
MRHTREMHAHEIPAHEIDVHEMDVCEMHIREIYVHEIHAYKRHACEIYIHKTHVQGIFEVVRMLTKHCALRLAFQLRNFNLKYSIFHHFPEHLYIKQRSFGDATILSKNP